MTTFFKNKHGRHIDTFDIEDIDDLNEHFNDQFEEAIGRDIDPDDKPMRNEAFDNYMDSLCQDGAMSEEVCGQLELFD